MPDRHITNLRNKAKPWKRRAAAKMSRNKTASEKLLWAKLKDKQLGVNIYAQKVTLGYIVDFWCPKAALVIEVDGSSHRKRKGWDKRRDAVMRRKGISVMRFTNEEVKNNLPAVVAMISDKIKRRRA
jgi:very-short-patch-repair endonuclease